MVRPANFDYNGIGPALAGTTAVVIDQVINRRSWKQTVVAATTGDITIATALNPGDSIDGITLAGGDRVLVWQQTAQEENGVYTVDTTPYRSPDFDASDEIVGAFVPVGTGGTTLGGKLYQNTNTTTITLETDPITFAEFTTGGGADTPFDHGNMGSTETIDLADGTWHQGTLNADCTITVTGYTVDEGVVLLFKVTQDGTGGWDIVWDSDVIFAGDDQPDQTASSVTWFLLWSDEGDATIYGAKVGSGGLTISEEGTPLATLATSLDFVGAGVVASGTGAAKTITIAGVTGSGVAAVGAVGPILITDTPAGSPLIFDDLLQNDDGTDLLYTDL